MPDSWLEICCFVPASEADQLADYLAELTGTGVCTANLTVDTFSVESIREPETVTLTAYVPVDTPLDNLIPVLKDALRDIAGRTGQQVDDPFIRRINSEDWANNWKAYFKPMRIGTRLVIKPTWELFDPLPGDRIIEIDPGMAFGTGTHQTTRLCLEAIERIYDSSQTRSLSILDVGTGSGVLAIGAALLGAGQVTGIDIDPEAILVAHQNAELNRVADLVTFSTTPLAALTGRFDLVVANILAEDLVRMRADLTSHLSTGGILILSGILTEREQFVVSGFQDTGLTFQSTRYDGEWCSIEFHYS